MTAPRHAVPRTTEALETFVENFTEEHGFPPLAGGEAQPAEAPAAVPDATPAPEAPAAPAAEAAPAPEAPPAWAEDFIGRVEEQMNAVNGQNQADPLLADLGFAQPDPAMPGVPAGQPGAIPGQYDPSLTGVQPNGGAQPQAAPGAMTPQQAEAQQIADWVSAQAEVKARELIQSEVMPQFERQQETERKEELQGLAGDYPEYFGNQKSAAEAIGRARTMAQTITGSPDLAREPGFIELTVLAGEAIEGRRQRAASTPTLPAPAGGVPIESPGPSAPAAPTNPNDDRAARIVAAGVGSGLSPVFGGRG